MSKLIVWNLSLDHPSAKRNVLLGNLLVLHIAAAVLSEEMIQYKLLFVVLSP